jgi:outer membrane protein W
VKTLNTFLFLLTAALAAVGQAWADPPAFGGLADPSRFEVKLRESYLQAGGGFSYDYAANAAFAGILPAGLSGVLSPGDRGAPEIALSYFLTEKASVEVASMLARMGDGYAMLPLSHQPSPGVSYRATTINFQYRASAFNGVIEPYLGAGLAVMSESAGQVSNVFQLPSISYGWDAEVGGDIPLSQHWLANIVVKKFFVRSALSQAQANPATLFYPAFNYYHINPTSVSLEPVFLGVGIGYKF